MKLPVQAQPIVRKVSIAMILGGGITPSQDCETDCRDKCTKILGPLGCMPEVCEKAMQNCMTKCKSIKCP
jgi:hypothetical protein